MKRPPVPEDDLEPVTIVHKGVHAHNRYSDEQITDIQAVYISALLAWVFIILSLGLVKDDYLILLILMIPPIVFLINYVSLGGFTCELEDQMFRSNFLSFAFLVAIILINWNSPLGYNDKTEFFKILITAFILLMLSLVDLWVDVEHMSVIKHIKTCLHTASLTLLALGLYLYYTYHTNQRGFDLE